MEQQVIEILRHLNPPEDWRKRIVDAMGQLLGDQKLEERIEEIKAVIARMDFRWGHGFVTDQENYLEERVRLQQELEQLAPMGDDDLEHAADLLAHFAAHWDATGADRRKQRELIGLIVARVWVKGDRVAAMSLRPDYHITLGLGSTKPTEISVGSYEDHTLSKRERRGSTTSVYTGCFVRAAPRRCDLRTPFRPNHRSSSVACLVSSVLVTSALKPSSVLHYYRRSA